MTDFTSTHNRLERRLVLLGWLHDRLGYGSADELLHDFREVNEGFSTNNHSYVHLKLRARSNKLKISLYDLDRYDTNIHSHVKSINKTRSDLITLKYFQYLAALYTEIFLDWYFNRRNDMLLSLNAWLDSHNYRNMDDQLNERFVDADLKKLAFWIATGGGKTILMHINYKQFMYYSKDEFDNIILITPNEGLSDQHEEELTASSIQSKRLVGLNSIDSDHNYIQIVEITSLTFEKRGDGKSITVESLKGNNLIFADEAHKGSSGEEWMKIRSALGEDGFTFEYSATFGQALTAANRDELFAKYGKSIAFDYSYRHFYNDGYGKDFRITNLQGEITEDQTNMLMLANMLSFYEQHLIFAEHGEEMRRYNLEKPLWIFVGSSVNAVHAKDKQKHSDVLTVARFLHKFLSNEGEWASNAITEILAGRSGLFDAENMDIFQNEFGYIRDTDADDIYTDILSKVLHTTTSSGLCLCDIQNDRDELGLRAANSEEYFGLIYIGDVSTFKKLAESSETGIVIERDFISKSLFTNIKNPTTTIEILIGAKKFKEGWDTWRVSNMGLLNIGRSEGSEIIQLFGRGIRLKGKGRTLKRSAALEGDHPPYLRNMETLNIFALRADYMTSFRDYLNREGAPTHGTVEVPLHIQPNQNLLGHGLVVPRLSSTGSFHDDPLILDVSKKSSNKSNGNPEIKIIVDLSSRVHQVYSDKTDIMESRTATPSGKKIPNDCISWVDLPDIYVELLARKENKEWYNMIIQPDMPEKILREGDYKLIVEDSVLHPRSFTDVQRLQDAAAIVVMKYAERFYQRYREHWERNNMTYSKLDDTDDNFQDYTIRIPRIERELIKQVQELVREFDNIYSEESSILPNVYFDKHLYMPLLVERNEKIKSKPPGLNLGEHKFIKELKKFCAQEKDKKLHGKDVFLLRNLSRGKGIGFFQDRGFYPDFILWIKSNAEQRIVFVEPHGMLHSNAPDNDEKVQLYSRLSSLTKKLKRQSGMQNVSIDSYIVSETDYSILAERYDSKWNMSNLAKNHVLFSNSEDYNYLDMIICGGD